MIPPDPNASGTGMVHATWGRLSRIQVVPEALQIMPTAGPNPRIVPVILSGGAGTRLWPLSREAAPKPFMPLPDGETLLAKTVARALALPGASDLITITNRDYYFHTKDVYAGISAPPPRSAAYLLE